MYSSILSIANVFEYSNIFEFILVCQTIRTKQGGKSYSYRSCVCHCKIYYKV